MFEPMPSMMRRERERQKLTLEQLSEMSGVSRSRISALEIGDENVSLSLVLKVAHALGMQELRVSGLRVAAAPPDLTALILAADAIEAASEVVEQAVESRSRLDEQRQRVSALLERVMAAVPDAGVAGAIGRLLEREDAADALRELAESPDIRRAAPRKNAAAARTSRKRAR